jgi:N-acylglucosamine-6-phosphate 2-epimerase
MKTLDKLHKGIVVSVQADEGEPLYPAEMICRLCRSVVLGGAVGLRLASPENVRLVKQTLSGIPIIAITKPKTTPSNAKSIVYITPTWEDIVSLHQAGADIIAMDATSRPRPNGDTVKSLVERSRAAYPELLLMADISTLEEGKYAESLGFDLISTTLSGYTEETVNQNTDEPDFELLKVLTQTLKKPVILEGRVWEPVHVKQAMDLGAFSVVIGSAITRPHLITQRFCQALPHVIKTP